MVHRRLFFLGASAFLAIMPLSGCGEEKKDPPTQNETKTRKVPEPTGDILSGKVTYRGTPVTGGTMTLLTAGEKSFKGYLRRDGTFKIFYLTPGEMKVAIETESIKDALSKFDELSKSHAPGRDIGIRENVPVYVMIPAKYGNPETSGLKVTINKGENTADFNLE